MAHLANFRGSDTVEGVMFARRYYGAEMAGVSIPAAEHSTVTAWGREREQDAYRNFVQQFLGPGKYTVGACVSDSYDLWNAIETIWCEELRDLIEASGSTLVIRPDSGPDGSRPTTGQRARHRVRGRGAPAALDLRRGQGTRRGGDAVTGAEALRTLNRPPKVFVAATGAGAGIQASLWSVPGSSAFLVGAAFPYAPHDTERLLGFRPARFCDGETAVELAIAAYLRAREAALADAPGGPGKGTAIGLGLTASVASVAPYRGDHRVFAASLSEDGATVWSARLPKGNGEAQRANDGQLADRLGIRAILAAARIESDEEFPAGVKVPRRQLSEPELRAMLYRHPVFGPGGSRAANADAPGLVLFPGSFDPCHDGHRMIVSAVERQYHRPVAYAVTADPVHKPGLRAVDLLDRVASIRVADGGAPVVVLTAGDPLFIDKARQFPGAGIALGVDALLRMLDPAWGPDVTEMLVRSISTCSRTPSRSSTLAPGSGLFGTPSAGPVRGCRYLTDPPSGHTRVADTRQPDEPIVPF